MRRTPDSKRSLSYIRLAVLEWNLSQTYDWRGGLHAAGSLILYESREGWQPARWMPSASADGRRIVVKAVNHSGGANTLLVHLQGSRVPAAATVTVYTITAGLSDTASLETPDRVKPAERTREYSRDLTIDLDPYTVAVIEISAR